MAEASSSAASEYQAKLTSKDYYFDSYAHFGIHEEMLKDKSRTLSYRASIVNNAHLVKDKIVLDVGCGTAILSMFAAKAGAAHVYAIDCSDIIDQARVIVETNGLADKITLIKGKMEEIDLPVPKVDVIISEWMGYALLYESMLNSVLYARDKYLVEGGVLLPDKATMYISGIEDEAYKSDKITWWNNVYGFDMSCMAKMATQEPLVDVVDPDQTNTDLCPFFEIDLNTVTVDDLTFTRPFKLKAKRDDYIHALVIHFDVDFSRCHKPIVLSTSAFSRYTHWKQTVLYLDQVLTVKAGETVEGVLTCKPNEKNHRDLDLVLHLEFKGEIMSATMDQKFFMR